MKNPKVSVVMPAYNAREYLREAVESILNQTFKDFEFLIIDDGSTDDTVEIIKSYRDPRIVLHQRQHKGLVDTLNYGIKVAKGEYIARMDTDDVSEPQRFELQVKFLDSHPEHALVGATTKIIDSRGKTLDISAEPINHDEIVQSLLVRNVLSHGSVMMRKKVVREIGGYDPEAVHAEDYDLWVKISRKWKIASLPQILFRWRLNPQGITITKSKVQRGTSDAIKRRQWRDLLNREVFPEVNLRAAWKRRFQSSDPNDPFWHRRGLMAVTYSHLGRELLLLGKRGKALRYIFAAIILYPLRLENLFYLIALLLPIKLFLLVETFLKAIKRVVLRALGKPVI